MFREELQNNHPGCYVSLSRVKRAYRACENLMTATERMATMAWWRGNAGYPSKELEVAWKDILFGAFHDVLPGTCIPAVEKDALAMFGHCSEILRRRKVRLFLSLLKGEPRARRDDTPIFVWNPHGFPATADVECEYNVSKLIMEEGKAELSLRDGRSGRPVVFQRELSESPIEQEWRAKVVLPMRLGPFEMRRVDASWREKKSRPRPWKTPALSQRLLTLGNRSIRVRLNPKTGLVEFAAPAGATRSFVRRGALRPTVWPDFDHAWVCGHPDRVLGDRPGASRGTPWRKPRGVFRLASRREAAAISVPSVERYAGKGPGPLPPLRVIEHGPVRTIVEAVFVMGASAIVRRYVLSKSENALEVRDRILWREADSMLKIAVPLAFPAANTIAETPYGAVTRPASPEHRERVNQRWVAATEGKGRKGAGGRFAAVANDGCYCYYFQYTVVNNPRSVDPHSPMSSDAISTFSELSQRLGKDRVIWRYDPIVVDGRELTQDRHRDNFRHLLDSLQGRTTRLVVSVVDPYVKTKRRMADRNGVRYHVDEYRSLLAWIVDAVQGTGITVQSCAEPVLGVRGIMPGACVDGRILAQLSGKKVSRALHKQREGCLCHRSVDIGVNNTCAYGCKYCYATSDHKVAQARCRQHNPEWNSLVGNVPPGSPRGRTTATC